MEEKKPYNFQIEGREKELKEHQGKKTICYKRRFSFGRGHFGAIFQATFLGESPV